MVMDMEIILTILSMEIGAGSLKAIHGETDKVVQTPMETELQTLGMKVINGVINTSGPRKMERIGGQKIVLNGLTQMEMDTEIIPQKEQQRQISSQPYLQPQSIPIMTDIQTIGPLWTMGQTEQACT